MDDSYEMQLAMQQSLVTDCEARVRALEQELGRAAEKHRMEQERLRELGRQLRLSVDENERLQDEKRQLLAIGRPEPPNVEALKAERASIVHILENETLPENQIEAFMTRINEIDFLLPDKHVDDLARRLEALRKIPASYGGRVVRTQFACNKPHHQK
jgi:predicted RNase H-like nuclease (RuvC/YqgF family)